MTEDEAVDTMKAVAHPVRLKILQALSGVERNVGAIESVTDIGQPTLSQQLAVLRTAGLVLTRREAKQIFYRLDETRIGAVADMIGALVNRTAVVLPANTKAPSAAARFARLG